MSTIKLPRLKKHLSIIEHGADLVELRTGVWNATSYTLSDDSGRSQLSNFLSALDGANDVEALAQTLNMPLEDVASLLSDLDARGLVEDGPTSALDDYLDAMTPVLGPRKQKYSRIVVISDSALASETRFRLGGDLGGIPVCHMLSSDTFLQPLYDRDTSWLLHGLRFQERIAPFVDWHDSLVLMLQSRVDPLANDVLNRIALAHGFGWVHGAIDGPFVLVGPAFLPGNTACYRCLETRILMNLREHASYQRYKTALAQGAVIDGGGPLLPQVAGLLVAHVALEVLNLVSTGRSFIAGKLLSLYLPTMEINYSEVLRAPNCEHCASQSGRDDTEMYFNLRAILQRTEEGK